MESVTFQLPLKSFRSTPRKREAPRKRRPPIRLRRHKIKLRRLRQMSAKRMTWKFPPRADKLNRRRRHRNNPKSKTVSLSTKQKVFPPTKFVISKKAWQWTNKPCSTWWFRRWRTRTTNCKAGLTKASAFWILTAWKLTRRDSVCRKLRQIPKMQPKPLPRAATGLLTLSQREFLTLRRQ